MSKSYSFLFIGFAAVLSLAINFSIINGQPIPRQKLQFYNESAESIVRAALIEQRGYGWLRELCAIGPRLSGSENSLKAIYWAEEKMKSLGFDSVWLQPVMVPKWVRGKTEKASISYSKKYKNKKLTIVSFGGSIGTPPTGISAEVIEVKSLDEVKYLGDKAKGKIIFYNRSFDNGLLNTFEGYGKAVDQRINGAIEAARHGAVATIVRSVQSGIDNIPHTGVMNYEEGINKIPAAAIGIRDADFLSNALKDEPALKIKINMDCQIFPDVQSYNVIGQLTGSVKPEEVIVVGGHFDSWDKGCGAHDDGAPCIQTMEALDLIKRTGIKPRRTIRCVLFINEENGLRGGIEYGRFSGISNEINLAAIESDRGAFTPRGFNVTTDSLTFRRLQDWLPILNKANIDWIRPGGSGGDVAQIKNAKALFGYVPDVQRYMDLHHSDNDIFSAVHPREMELGSAAIAILSMLLSEEGL
ncbi:MAG: peptidase M28 family protein [Ignavibacteriae bacterium HGW-Ignavibacteriae-3]|nr:MAG: peptidase M28 family protein [Ignavibacteriae bacterium HGW-Ignavibacteriae-3]